MEPSAAHPAFPSGYGVREAAAVLGLSPAQIRSFIRTGLVRPRRGARGTLRFSFQDLVLLRTAKDLSRRIPTRKLRTALARLREQLPHGRDLTEVRILADGRRVVARDGNSSWEPSSGQLLLDFNVREIVADIAPLARRAARSALADDARMTVDDWCELAGDLEACEPDSARDAYRRALELDPGHVQAHVNLGRLLHDQGNLSAAESHYRIATRIDPSHAVAWYNLGVCAEDQREPGRAARFYRRAVRLDAKMAEAHLNLGLLYETLGRPKLALRHMGQYRLLLDENDPNGS
jgi:tetratricopeptide (TPR) repeat protein